MTSIVINLAERRRLMAMDHSNGSATAPHPITAQAKRTDKLITEDAVDDILSYIDVVLGPQHDKQQIISDVIDCLEIMAGTPRKLP